MNCLGDAHMKRTRLQNISRVILDSLQGKKNIQEEQVSIFLDGMVDLEQGADEGTIPAECQTLEHWIGETWQYRDLSDFSQESTFLLGGLWGAFALKRIQKKRKKDTFCIDQLVSKYRDYYWFFSAIANKPGIMHKQLAARGRKTTSELSQFVARVYKEDLFSFNRVGREKYYFLQEKGEEVYRRMKEEKQAVAKKQEFPVKQIAEDNDNYGFVLKSSVELARMASEMQIPLYRDATVTTISLIKPFKNNDIDIMFYDGFDGSEEVSKGVECINAQ